MTTTFDPFRPAGCRCPGVADLVRAELEGRQLPPCPAHQPDAAAEDAQVAAAAERQRVIATLAAPPQPAPDPPAEHPTETLKDVVTRLLHEPPEPAADPRAAIPLNATAAEWEAHLGLNDQE